MEQPHHKQPGTKATQTTRADTKQKTKQTNHPRHHSNIKQQESSLAPATSGNRKESTTIEEGTLRTAEGPPDREKPRED
jgi:hypothetical protein